MGTKPAKLAIRADRDAGRNKDCPSCGAQMNPVKFVRQTRPSGIFWHCEKCGHEQPTK
jgi:predicted RNA-binding Zn-ribbon protein involved in translation (DUF1610 family)